MSRCVRCGVDSNTVRTLAMVVVDAVICARSSSDVFCGTWACMNRAVGVGLRCVEESTVAAARMLDCGTEYEGC